MDYVLIKQVHVGFAVVSIVGFMLRWSWRMSGSHLAQLRLTRTAPHVVDTLFLTSGLVLIFTIQQYPLNSPWLTSKISGLVVYILLGMLAMSGKISKIWRVITFFAAVSTFAWILSVARTKSPWGFLGLM